MDYVKPGFMASLPLIAALVGVLLSGWVSDLMERKGLSLGTARKLPIIVGLALTVFMLGGEIGRASCRERV